MAGTGFEPPQDSSGHSTICGESVAESGARAAVSRPHDPELGAVIDASPGLPPAIKAGILALIHATEPSPN